jgi:preprotein translocase subunit SecE
MKKKSQSYLAKHYTWKRLNFLTRRIKELERVEIPTKRQVNLLKRYRKEWAIVFVSIT